MNEWLMMNERSVRDDEWWWRRDNPRQTWIEELTNSDWRSLQMPCILEDCCYDHVKDHSKLHERYTSEGMANQTGENSSNNLEHKNCVLQMFHITILPFVVLPFLQLQMISRALLLPELLLWSSDTATLVIKEKAV